MSEETKKTDGFAKLPSFSEVRSFLRSLKAFLFATSLEKSQYFISIKKDLGAQVAPPVKFAYIIVGLAILFFGVWGGLAPLDSAITAPGNIVLSGNRKIIQHDGGGTIKNILVKDGEIVKKGQPLIELSTTYAKASFKIILSQLRTALATERRLLAEENNLEKIDFSSEYLDPNAQEAQRLINNQQQLFETRRAALNGRLESIKKQIQQGYEKITGEKGQLKSIQSQLATAKANAADAEKLFKKEVVNKLYYTNAQNEVQRLEGHEAALKANIAVTEQTIMEGELQLLNVRNEFMNKIEEEYRGNHVALLEAKQKYNNAKEVLNRTIIRSPVDGIVTAMQYHTIGGVIAQGVRIMEIVSQDDDLIIDAYVSPNEINSLHVGMLVKVQLNPYKQRLVPRIAGEVTYVSADKIANERTGQEFYLVKVKIDHDMISKLNANVKLQPGMPVTVFIIRGTRTFLEYMLSPIVDSFHKAFKEA